MNQTAAARARAGGPSVIADLLRRAETFRSEGRDVINLGAGVPDYPAPDYLLESAVLAVRTGNNSYGDARGVKELRQALSDRLFATTGVRYGADSEITVTDGASPALTSTLLALVNRGDGVVVFEPFFELFIAQIGLASGKPRFVRLSGSNWGFSEPALERALSGSSCRFLLLNTPHNPTGRVFSQAELEFVASCCKKHDIIVLADETYEPFTYGLEHTSIATLPGMRERTVLIGSVSKVFNVAGWRVGSIAAPEALTRAIRRVSDLSLGAAVPLQTALANSMDSYDTFTSSLVEYHRPLRDALCDALGSAGFHPFVPEGTLSILADATELGFDSDLAVCESLLNDAAIIAAPGAAFFRNNRRQYVRFSFARTQHTIKRAVKALESWSARTPR